jgi:hypothetical protein
MVGLTALPGCVDVIMRCHDEKESGSEDDLMETKDSIR